MYYHYNEKAKNSRSDLLRGCMDIGQCARNQKSKCKIKIILKELEIQNEICWEVAWPADDCGAKESAGFSFPRRAASTWMTQLKTQKWNLKTQNSKFSFPRRAASTWETLQLKTEISKLKTQNPKLRTQNWNVERYCNECVVTVSTGFNLIWHNLNGENLISNSDSAAEWAQVSTWSAP